MSPERSDRWSHTSGPSLRSIPRTTQKRHAGTLPRGVAQPVRPSWSARRCNHSSPAAGVRSSICDGRVHLLQRDRAPRRASATCLCVAGIHTWCSHVQCPAELDLRRHPQQTPSCLRALCDRCRSSDAGGRRPDSLTTNKTKLVGLVCVRPSHQPFLLLCLFCGDDLAHGCVFWPVGTSSASPGVLGGSRLLFPRSDGASMAGVGAWYDRADSARRTRHVSPVGGG